MEFTNFLGCYLFAGTILCTWLFKEPKNLDNIICYDPTEVKRKSVTIIILGMGMIILLSVIKKVAPMPAWKESTATIFFSLLIFLGIIRFVTYTFSSKD